MHRLARMTLGSGDRDPGKCTISKNACVYTTAGFSITVSWAAGFNAWQGGNGRSPSRFAHFCSGKDLRVSVQWFRYVPP